MNNSQTGFAPALRTGLALGATVGLFYALCTVAWVAAPGVFLNLANSLFHGVDVSSLVQPRPFAVQDFLTALIVLSLWAFLAGTFFAWLRQRLAP